MYNIKWKQRIQHYVCSVITNCVRNKHNSTKRTKYTIMWLGLFMGNLFSSFPLYFKLSFTAGMTFASLGSECGSVRFLNTSFSRVLWGPTGGWALRQNNMELGCLTMGIWILLLPLIAQIIQPLKSFFRLSKTGIIILNTYGELPSLHWIFTATLVKCNLAILQARTLEFRETK